jgi:hypothetical protein
MSRVFLAPTITKVPADARGGVVVSGSHGGAYAGYLAARSGARAVLLNDAGVGREQAGLGCLDYCHELGMAAATVAHGSARIGDAQDMMARGVVSHVNDLARRAGCVPGMACREAASALLAAPDPARDPAAPGEARLLAGHNPAGLRIVCVDSISLVREDDAGQIVMSGSHGGIVAGQPGLAIAVAARAALYNDAGIGVDEAGVGRLPVLDARGIAAATVAASSARIGDGRSTYEDGVLSRVNRVAAGLGLAPGMTAHEAAARVTPVAMDAGGKT